MKKWWAVLANIGIAAGTSIAGNYVPPQFKEAVVLSGTIAAAEVTRRASNSNPDGTPAEVAYRKSAPPPSKRNFYPDGMDDEHDH